MGCTKRRGGCKGPAGLPRGGEKFAARGHGAATGALHELEGEFGAEENPEQVEGKRTGVDAGKDLLPKVETVGDHADVAKRREIQKPAGKRRGIVDNIDKKRRNCQVFQRKADQERVGAAPPADGQAIANEEKDKAGENGGWVAGDAKAMGPDRSLLKQGKQRTEVELKPTEGVENGYGRQEYIERGKMRKVRRR